MAIGMATIKLTVTLPEEQLAEVPGLVEAGQAANVSAFVQHAVRIALNDVAGWREMLDEALQQTGGLLTNRSVSGLIRYSERKPPKRRKSRAA